MELITAKISLTHFLFLSATIFAIGIIGIILNKRNVINILMSIELMLLAANINFVTFSSYFNDLAGQISTIIIMTIAAAEVSIGLAIVVVFYRTRGSIAIEDMNKLKG